MNRESSARPLDDRRLLELRRKYLAERDKRMDPTRAAKIPLGGSSTFLDDPHTPRKQRDPLTDHVDAIAVGAGLSGLVCAARLRQAGVERVRLIDTAGDVGGVWYWNRYPGAMCDVESYIYMPLLEELGYVPSQKYASADEIRAHARAIAQHYDLYGDALFHTRVERAQWNAQHKTWAIETDCGDNLSCQFLILANGPFSEPKIPAIPGLDKFEGRSFHTSRWDYSYTGGASDDHMTNLTDKIVGLVGTGATAVQCTTPLAHSAKELYVFQRTPSTIGYRRNSPTDPVWASNLKPGWQAERMRNFANIVTGSREPADMVNDGWTELFGALSAPQVDSASPEDSKYALEHADFVMMEAIRARVDSVVTDRATAEALKPYYRYLCKRPCFHDEYLGSFNLPNVHLVDTQGKGIDTLTAHGVKVGSNVYDLDCLILATGFDVGDTAPRVQFDLVGLDGVSLNEKWAKGVCTLFGIMSRGFPNLFLIPWPNTGQSIVVVNYMHTAQIAARVIGHVVEEMRRRKARAFDVKEDAERTWVKLILRRRKVDSEFLQACTPGRDNGEGSPWRKPLQNANFEGGPREYTQLLDEWIQAGNLGGLDIAQLGHSGRKPDTTKVVGHPERS